jgi:hypothetical protein
MLMVCGPPALHLRDKPAQMNPGSGLIFTAVSVQRKEEI